MLEGSGVHGRGVSQSSGMSRRGLAEPSNWTDWNAPPALNFPPEWKRPTRVSTCDCWRKSMTLLVLVGGGAPVTIVVTSESRTHATSDGLATKSKRTCEVIVGSS